MPECSSVVSLLDKIQTSGGRLIVIEGVDGSGKDTQVDMLEQTLKDVLKKKIVKTFEPWRIPESPCGMRIDRIMNHKEHEIDPGDGGIDPVKLQTIYTADRFLHWTKLIIPELLKGSIIVCARERPSTFTYGNAYGISPKEILGWHVLLPGPDLIIYVKVSLETAIERMKGRGEPATYFEKKKEYLRKIIASYEEIVASCVLPNVVVVDGEGNEQDVHEKVLSEVVNKFSTDFSL